MKLFLLSQTANDDYDTYDSAVVCAVDEEDARNIHPDGHEYTTERENDRWGSWARKSEIRIVELGEALPSVKQGVVCASYNAG